jgi:hypothetical protein
VNKLVSKIVGSVLYVHKELQEPLNISETKKFVFFFLIFCVNPDMRDFLKFQRNHKEGKRKGTSWLGRGWPVLTRSENTDADNNNINIRKMRIIIFYIRIRIIRLPSASVRLMRILSAISI